MRRTPSLDKVFKVVEGLAAQKDLWDEFAPSEAGEFQARYLISGDPDHTYALHLNVM